LEQLMDHQEMLSEKPCHADGWSNLPDVLELSRFLDTVAPGDDGCWQGEFFFGDSSFLLPEHYRDKI